MKDDKVRLRMLPVCHCGYIFRDGIIIHRNILKTNGINYPEYYFEPAMCPNCKKEIECIEDYKHTVEHIRY